MKLLSCLTFLQNEMVKKWVQLRLFIQFIEKKKKNQYSLTLCKRLILDIVCKFSKCNLNIP